jgi:hypothetical protein
LDEAGWNGTPREVRDSSRYANHGTATAGANSTAAVAKFGRAGSFDGNGFIDIPDDVSLHPTNALTISAWFYATAVNGVEQGLVVKRRSWASESSFAVFIYGGDARDATNTLVYVDVDDINDRFTSDPQKPIVANTWYHVVVVYDGGLSADQRVRLYMNGVLDGAPHRETSPAIPAYTGPLHIGDLQEGGKPFQGYIDEVAIWLRALSPEEVTALYASNAPL